MFNINQFILEWLAAKGLLVANGSNAVTFNTSGAVVDAPTMLGEFWDAATSKVAQEFETEIADDLPQGFSRSPESAPLHMDGTGPAQQVVTRTSPTLGQTEGGESGQVLAPAEEDPKPQAEQTTGRGKRYPDLDAADTEEMGF